MTTPTTVQVRLQIRADTAANWTSANPILLANELGLETDTNKFKVGDGTTAWNSLAYFPSIVSGGTVLGNLEIGTTGTLTFEGSTANGFEITLGVVDPTADRTILLPDQSGTVVIGGNASITDADIAANAEIAVSKLANGTANQVLVTDGTDVSWSDNLTLAGDLTVNGTTTTINTQDLLVEDKNIIIGNVTTPSDVTADGGGITLKGSTDKTINWIDATDAWTLSEHVNIASGKEYRIDGTKVLDATSLGSGVVSSSLTSVGTISSGTWEGTAIGAAYLPTGTTSAAGIVQLEDSTSSTSTTTAATPNAVKSAYDLANAALPASGGTLTGDVTLNAQSDLRFADSDSSNWVALQAPATVASNVTWTLPNADGTSGQILSTDGAGALSWATGGGGAWTYISSVTASNSASVAFTSGIDNTYGVYMIIGTGLIPSVDAQLRGRTSSNGGSTYASSGGDYSTSGYDQNLTVGSNTELELTGTIESTSSSGCDFELYLYNPSNTSRRKYIRSHAFRQTPTAGTYNNEPKAHMRHSTSIIDAIQFYLSSGNIASGTFRLYGLKNS